MNLNHSPIKVYKDFPKGVSLELYIYQYTKKLTQLGSY